MQAIFGKKKIRSLNKQKLCFLISSLSAFHGESFPGFLGFDENIESQGELILQESFQVWDPKTLIRKGRERHLFLFEMSLVFSKEVKDSSGRSKYIYKSKLFVSMEVQMIVFRKMSKLDCVLSSDDLNVPKEPEQPTVH